MSCNGCITSASGKPSGCRNNGTCTNGSCNRRNTYDWLSGILSGNSSENSLVEVSFSNGMRKEFFRTNNLPIESRDVVVVEVDSGGYDIGAVSLTGELVRLQLKRKKINDKTISFRNVIRKANDFDLNKWDETRRRKPETMSRAREIAKSMKMEMKIGDVEFQADGRKATFHYIAESRVDFRELIKVFASEFKVRIEMNHMGIRQEASRIGGIGSCGRELCCSTWLTEFKAVNTATARYQQLSINQTKLSGQCGRLKCCLNFELDTYLDALQDFPKNADKIETEAGTAYLMKTDIFRKLMHYAYKDNNAFHALPVNKVKEMLEANRQGQKANNISEQAVKAPVRQSMVQEEIKYADVVGQVTLEPLKKKKSKNRNKQKKQGTEKKQDSSNQEKIASQNQPKKPVSKNQTDPRSRPNPPQKQSRKTNQSGAGKKEDMGPTRPSV